MAATALAPVLRTCARRSALVPTAAVLPRASERRRRLHISPRPRATESWIFGPLGLPALTESRTAISQRFAAALFKSIERDEQAKSALGRVIHLSQRAGISPKMWLETPDPEHPLRQVLEKKGGRLASLAEQDDGFREAVSQMKSEFKRLGVMDQLDILFLLVDAAANPPQLGEPLPSESAPTRD